MLAGSVYAAGIGLPQKIEIFPGQLSHGSYGLAVYEGFFAEQLVDGNKGDQFAVYANATGPAGMYVQINLTNFTFVEYVALYARVRNAADNEPYYFVDEAALELSLDGVAFTEASRNASGIVPCFINVNKSRILLGGFRKPAKYIRIHITNTSVSLAAQMSEIEVYGYLANDSDYSNVSVCAPGSYYCTGAQAGNYSANGSYAMDNQAGDDISNQSGISEIVLGDMAVVNSDNPDNYQAGRESMLRVLIANSSSAIGIAAMNSNATGSNIYDGYYSMLLRILLLPAAVSFPLLSVFAT